MAKEFNLQKWLIQWLRRGSYRVPGFYNSAKAAARVSRGRYKCAKCQKQFRNGEFQMDHIQPVIQPGEGFRSYDDFISRLYCGASGLQLLCKPCHQKKTNKENKKR